MHLPIHCVDKVFLVYVSNLYQVFKQYHCMRDNHLELSDLLVKYVFQLQEAVLIFYSRLVEQSNFPSLLHPHPIEYPLSLICPSSVIFSLSKIRFANFNNNFPATYFNLVIWLDFMRKSSILDFENPLQRHLSFSLLIGIYLVCIKRINFNSDRVRIIIDFFFSFFQFLTIYQGRLTHFVRVVGLFVPI